MQDELSTGAQDVLAAFKSRRREIPAQTSNRAWAGVAAGIATGAIPAAAEAATDFGYDAAAQGGSTPPADPMNPADIGLSDGPGLEAADGWEAVVHTPTTVGGIKAFLVTVAVGTTGLVGARAVVPAEEPTPSVAAVSATSAAADRPAPAPSATPPSLPPTPSPIPEEPSPSPIVVAATELEAAPSAVPARPTSKTKVRVPASPIGTVAPSAPASATEDALAREVALMREIRGAVRESQFPRALTLLEQHTDEFPAGALAPDRRAFKALSQCASGAGNEGRAGARKFLRRYPDSPHRAQLRTSCGLDE